MLIYHSLPKIHKNTFPSPMRPIVAGIGSILEKRSTWVDHHLQPIVKDIPGFIQDTKHVITMLDKAKWSQEYCRLSCDVISLYPSIPHHILLQELPDYLNWFSAYSEATKGFFFITIQFLLQHNFFSFDGDFYIQTCGASMGAHFSPSIANLYMLSGNLNTIFHLPILFPTISGGMVDSLMISSWYGRAHNKKLYILWNI